MRALSHLFTLAVFFVMLSGQAAWAVPITWQSSGTITHVVNEPPFDVLGDLEIGTTWTLELTFDPAASGTLLHPGANPTYRYDDAVSARFRLGEFEYTNATGDIYVNADLPVVGSSTPLGGPGLVQFQFLKGWLGGGPDLNAGLGLLLASYNDLTAFSGQLPSVPHQYHPPDGKLGGLLWKSWLPGGSEFSSAEFNPVPVPEPTSLVLVGSGLLLAAARRRKRNSGA